MSGGLRNWDRTSLDLRLLGLFDTDMRTGVFDPILCTITKSDDLNHWTIGRYLMFTSVSNRVSHNWRNEKVQHVRIRVSPKSNRRYGIVVSSCPKLYYLYTMSTCFDQRYRYQPYFPSDFPTLFLIRSNRVGPMVKSLRHNELTHPRWSSSRDFPDLRLRTRSHSELIMLMGKYE